MPAATMLDDETATLRPRNENDDADGSDAEEPDDDADGSDAEDDDADDDADGSDAE